MNIYLSENKNCFLSREKSSNESKTDNRIFYDEQLSEKNKKIRCNIFVDLHEATLQSESGLYHQYGGIVCKFRINDLILGVLRGVLPYNDDFLA